MLARRAQYHQSVMSSHTSVFDVAFQTRVAGLTQALTHAGIDASTAKQMAYARIYGMMQGQSAMLGYIETIWVFAIICLIMVPMPALMRRTKRAKAPIGAH
jgi:DHA2 family multidrug resistance protein